MKMHSALCGARSPARRTNLARDVGEPGPRVATVRMDDDDVGA